ncbi:hypothetical protein, partial [Bordetella avium]
KILFNQVVTAASNGGCFVSSACCSRSPIFGFPGIPCRGARELPQNKGGGLGNAAFSLFLVVVLLVFSIASGGAYGVSWCEAGA